MKSCLSIPWRPSLLAAALAATLAGCNNRVVERAHTVSVGEACEVVLARLNTMPDLTATKAIWGVTYTTHTWYVPPATQFELHCTFGRVVHKAFSEVGFAQKSGVNLFQPKVTPLTHSEGV